MKDRAALAGAVTGRMVTAALWAVFKFALAMLFLYVLAAVGIALLFALLD